MVAITKPQEQTEAEARPSPTSQYAMTYHDIAALPDFIRCYEIREGELVMSPAPSVNHQEVLADLTRLEEINKQKIYTYLTGFIKELKEKYGEAEK